MSLSKGLQIDIQYSSISIVLFLTLLTGDEQQLEDLMPEMKIKEAGERKFADGACNTSVSDAQSGKYFTCLI